MEAISYGLPLISTNVSGIPEICKNDYNVILVPEKDVNALITALNKLRKDQMLRSSFSRKSLELSFRYNIEINSRNKLYELGWICSDQVKNNMESCPFC